jgi:hypothetical protein
MGDLLNKLSSYNVFNYLLPGILFAVLSEFIVGISLLQTDIVTGLFVYYFCGLVISRIGSILIEPLFKRLSIVTFSEYSAFVKASKRDSKIELFSEINNMYRTIIALVATLFILRLHVWLESSISWLKDWRSAGLMIALLILFVFSYRKQTQFINKRIDVGK